jgi:hypothetical protein
MNKKYALALLVCALVSALALTLVLTARPGTIATEGEPVMIIGDPYNAPGMISLLYSGVLAKHAPGGVLVRGVWDRDDQGSFTAIPDADNFHQLKDPEGAPTFFYRAGDIIYTFINSPTSKKSSQEYELLTPVRIPNVDVATFVPGAVSGISYLAKDKNHVYFAGDTVPDTTIDPKTLTGIAEYPSLIKDAKHVYELGGDTHYAVTPFDPATLAFLNPIDQEQPTFAAYIKDKNGVYFDKEKIVGADPETFAVYTSPKLEAMKGGLIYSYGKDKSNVYYNGQLVARANLQTFTPVYSGGYYSYFYGKDANAVYDGPTTITQADPKTFQVLWRPIYEGCGLTKYTKDAEHVFLKGSVVEGADAATFTPLINGYGRDKNGIWEGARLRADLKPDFEPQCDYG